MRFNPASRAFLLLSLTMAVFFVSRKPIVRLFRLFFLSFSIQTPCDTLFSVKLVMGASIEHKRNQSEQELAHSFWFISMVNNSCQLREKLKNSETICPSNLKRFFFYSIIRLYVWSLIEIKGNQPEQVFNHSSLIIK